MNEYHTRQTVLLLNLELGLEVTEFSTDVETTKNFKIINCIGDAVCCFSSMFPCFLNAAVGRMRTKIRQDHQLRGHVLRGEIRLMIYLIIKIHVYTHDVHVIYKRSN